MKTSFTFTSREIARLIFDKLQAEGKLPISPNGGYDCQTKVTPSYNGGYEVTFMFEDSRR